jgi:hypothetical protein
LAFEPTVQPHRSQRADFLRKTARLQAVGLTLAGFEPRIDLVDDVNPATAANNLVGAVAGGQSPDRVSDLHRFTFIAVRRIRIKKQEALKAPANSRIQ